MHRIVVFTESDTTFVREGAFVLPAFDGQATFNFEAAMVGIGGKCMKPGEWNVPLAIPELAEYLSTLQNAPDPVVARNQWARRQCIRSTVDSIPFINGKIDWREFAKQVESRVAREFPLCV